jgi:hypothetical protein
MTLDRVKTGRLEFHPPKEIKRIAGLRCNPGVDFHGSIPDLAQVAINVPDVSNHHATRAVLHNHAPFLKACDNEEHCIQCVPGDECSN